MKKKLLKIFLILFTITTAAVPAQAAVIYETVSSQTISRGVTYEVHRQVTENGMLDIYVLKATLEDPNITFAPVTSTKEMGLRETTVTLLSDNGAIAGVNGDFFDMNGSLSSAMGPEIADGRLISIDGGANAYNNSLAGFFIGQNNNPFIEYIKSEIRFHGGGSSDIYIKAINKATEMEQPVYLDRSAMADTGELDARFPGLVKILVENGTITKLSEAGETLSLPEDGFIIVMNSAKADEHLYKFKVGQTAEIKVSANIDLSTIKTGIGGGSRILLNGEAVSDGYVINGGNRNPRTAVGISRDNKQLILMVVDGRSHSVGATQAEMAEILLSFGAYNAMNLDGGGSTTMAIRQPGTDLPKSVNTFSEGSQRKVANAFGIFNKAAQGPMTALVVEPKGQVAFEGLPLLVNIYGLDEYYNRIELDRNQLIINVNDPNGHWQGEYFYPARTGELAFIAAYEGFATEVSIESKVLAQIVPSQTSITMGEGGQKEIYFTGKSDDGFTAPLPSLMHEFSSPNLGVFEGNIFTAGPLQKGYIKAAYGDIAAYIEVSIGYKKEQFTSFETQLGVYGTSYPEPGMAYAAVRTEEFSDGGQSLGLTYTFGQSDETQAAYAVFDPPLILPDNPQGMSISVFGDNSNHWLRARLVGADGQEAVVDLAKEINWEGWKELSADFPGGLKSPVTLDRIYAAALSNQDTEQHTIYFDNIHITYLMKFGKIDIPAATVFKDPLQADLSNLPAIGYDLGFFAGTDDFVGEAGVKYYEYEPAYEFNLHEDTAIVRLTAAQGGLTSTNPYQWGQFTADVSSSNARQVIIQLDKNPLNFTYAKEYQLLHDVLKEMSKAGRRVLVVSTEGPDNSVTIREGIRYINIGGGEVHVLRIRITNEGIAYELR